MNKLQISKTKSQTVNIMLHKNHTVSVGLSGDLNSPKTLERIQAVQQALDEISDFKGQYKVSTQTLNDTHGLQLVGVVTELVCVLNLNVQLFPKRTTVL